MTADGNIRYLPPPAFEGEHSLAVNTTTYLHILYVVTYVIVLYILVPYIIATYVI